MRGRPRKPTEQRRREGNPGKRPLAAELELPASKEIAVQGIACPEDLPEEGKELWQEVVPPLYASGVLHQVDRAALTAMCLAWAESERASKVIATEGFFTEGSTGQLVEHPAVEIRRKAHAIFLRYAEQYGMTAAARARISAANALRDAAARSGLAQILDAEAEDVDVIDEDEDDAAE